MTDNAIKRGTVVFVPNGKVVRSLTVTSANKGVTYVKFPGDKKSTRLNPGQFFTDELLALKAVDGNLGTKIKNFRASVSEARRALRSDEQTIKGLAIARDKVRGQIKSIKNTP